MNDVEQLIESLLAASEHGVPEGLTDWAEQVRIALRHVYGEGDPMMQRFDAVTFHPTSWAGFDGYSKALPGAQQRGTEDSRALLKAALTSLDLTNEDQADPLVDIAALHPWFASAAASLWSAGHHRKAVEEAARTVELQLKVILGWEGSGVDLVTQGFSSKPPTGKRPRLRFAGFAEGTDSWINAHEGARDFGRGCFRRIRNLYQHTQEPSEVEALEALASISLLARWIEQATLHTHEESSS